MGRATSTIGRAAEAASIRVSPFGAIAQLVAEPGSLQEVCDDFDTGKISFVECRKFLREAITDYFQDAWKRKWESPVTNEEIDDILERGSIWARREYRATPSGVAA